MDDLGLIVMLVGGYLIIGLALTVLVVVTAQYVFEHVFLAEAALLTVFWPIAVIWFISCIIAYCSGFTAKQVKKKEQSHE